jgi:hypothetical protein
MAKEGLVGWTQPAGNTGPQIKITIKGGGIDFVGRVGSLTYPGEALLTDQGFFTTIGGVNSNRYRLYSENPPTPPPSPSPTPAPPPYTPPSNPSQRLKVIRCNGTGGVKHLSVSPFGNYSNNMSIRFGSPYPSGYCYTIIDQDTTGSLDDGTDISVISAYLTCIDCNNALPPLAGTTAATCLDNGGQNGRITVTPSGGTGVYYFKLNGAGSYGVAGASQNVDGLADATYAITLYDDAGNTTALTSRTLNCYIQPDGTVNTSCTATNNAGGKITVTSPTGGTGVYYFKVNDGVTQYTTGAGGGVSGLADGTYNIKIYDSIGNVRDKGNFTIACYEAPTGTASYTCIDYTATNARIDVTGVTGGTGTGYYFTLNGSGTYTVGAGNGPSSLANGTYAVVLHDSYGSRSLGNVVVDCADCTISGGTASQVPAPTPAPAPAAPTPTPAAPTPTPAAPTPTPEAPTPTPAAPPPVSSLDWDCVLNTCTNVGTGLGVYADYAECIASGCEGTPPSPAAPTPTPTPSPAAPTPTPAPPPEAIAPTPTPEAPTPTPEAPTPTPEAPTPTPAAPTPTPAAPTPTPSPAVPSYTVGYSGVDGDTACTNYETANFVTVYAASSLGNGVQIYTNANLTGTPTDGYYSTGTNYWYSTSGVLGSQTGCYTPPPPAAPTPTPSPAPTPSPVSTDTWWETTLFFSVNSQCNSCGGIDGPGGTYYVYGPSADLADAYDLSFNLDGSGKNPATGWYSDGFTVRSWTGGLIGSFNDNVTCSSLICE